MLTIEQKIALTLGEAAITDFVVSAKDGDNEITWDETLFAGVYDNLEEGYDGTDISEEITTDLTDDEKLALVEIFKDNFENIANEDAETLALKAFEVAVAKHNLAVMLNKSYYKVSEGADSVSDVSSIDNTPDENTEDTPDENTEDTPDENTNLS